jgi:hypothetical protein
LPNHGNGFYRYRGTRFAVACAGDAALNTFNDSEVFMGKLGLCMLAFLVLAIGVGVLGTIPPG